MPFGINKHSNRSQQALDNSQARPGSGNTSNPASLPAGDETPSYDARTAQPQPPYPQAHDNPQPYLQTNLHPEGEPVVYQELADVPVRSQSQRYTTGYQTATSPPSTGETRLSFSDDQYSTDIRKSYSIGANTRLQPPPPAVEQKKSKSRFFSGFSSKSKDKAETPISPAQGSHGNFGELGRRISKRHKDRPELRTYGQNNSVEGFHQQQDWQSSQSSEQLPSPPEVDEEDSSLDPFLIREQAGHPPKLQTYNPNYPPGNIHLQTDQDPTIRAVNESLVHQQYQQQHLQTPLSQISQRSPLQQQQQQQQLSQVNTPVSPHDNQPIDYQLQSQQPQQYHIQPGGPPPQNPNNLQYRPAQNPEVISQLSHDSPVDPPEDQRPSSVQGTQAQGGLTVAQDFPSRSTSIQGPRPIGQPPTMAPPPSQSSQARKSLDINKALQGEGRSGPPPAYSAQPYSSQSQQTQQGQQQSGSNPLPPIPGSQQGSNYRGSSALQREYGQGNNGEQGRSTPPLTNNREEMTDMDRLILKYKKVKGLYFEKQAQVEQLQNTLANQRMSQSRTSLDDNEYATRFNRLDGAIKEIAFSIRKDWKQIPRWLAPYVNQDAQRVGTKEMTAVGRAFISRWIAEEIFGKCFHPGLELDLSEELKRIENNVRYGTAPATNQEEHDALSAKIVQWRLTTVEGLSGKLFSPQVAQTKADFSRMCVTNLTASLINHLQDSASQGIEGNATSIVELAVGIASHLPLESRDICLSYPLPGEPVQSYMKIEAPLPPLDNPGREEGDGGSSPKDGKDQSEEKAKNIPTSGEGKRPSVSSGSGDPSDTKGGKEGEKKIRFAGFFGVEVRGRQWLVNPPVWTF